MQQAFAGFRHPAVTGSTDDADALELAHIGLKGWLLTLVTGDSSIT